MLLYLTMIFNILSIIYAQNKLGSLVPYFFFYGPILNVNLNLFETQISSKSYPQSIYLFILVLECHDIFHIKRSTSFVFFVTTLGTQVKKLLKCIVHACL